MKRYVILALFLSAAALARPDFWVQAQAPAQAPAAAQGGGGRGPSPEQQAALARQDALEKATPQLQVEATVLPLQVPGRTIGETTGVAHNSKKHLFVYTRAGNAGPARGSQAAQIYEFDEKFAFVKEWGPGAYGFSYAHDIRFDKYDNLWAVDEGSNMVMKFNPQGVVTMVLGRKPEAIDYMEEFLERGEKTEERFTVGRPNSFNRPTDVTWDTEDNIFVSDGYGNSRVAKMNKDGDWVKAVGTRGNGPLQFNTPHAIAADAKGNIYVADRGNSRIQVYDPDLNFIKQFTNVRAPWAMCITPGPTQYLYSGDGSSGHIYKLDLDGKLIGWWGSSGKRVGQFGLIHELDCVSENELYQGDASTWRVQRLVVKGPMGATK